jgi:hypothetical protein
MHFESSHRVLFHALPQVVLPPEALRHASYPRTAHALLHRVLGSS